MTLAAMVGFLGADITCLKMPKPWLLLGSTAPPTLFLPQNFPNVDLDSRVTLPEVYLHGHSMGLRLLMTQSSLQKFC